MLRIYYDAYQEGMWFAKLHPRLRDAVLVPFPSMSADGRLQQVLAYDRPDIVLADEDDPILVVERTIEVPSGHNVGQRFARLAAAAQCGVPAVYFGPYAARKHGGITSGPRYMNLRLFKALDRLMEIEQSAVTTIRWPVDADYEIVQDASKDERVVAYLETFFAAWDDDPNTVSQAIFASAFEQQQEAERQRFVRTEVRRAAGYEVAPGSVASGSGWEFGIPEGDPWYQADVVFYRVGMNRIRSDPYTGMAILYAYLYCGGLTDKTRPLVLGFPGVTIAEWRAASRGRGAGSKTVRLYKLVSDGIVFADGFLARDGL